MLINKSSLKQPFATELPAKCNEIIRALLGEETGPELLCYRLELLTELCGQTGKVEFSQYYEVLNMCDTIIQQAIKRGPDGLMAIDKLGHLDNVVIAILKFTGALFENTFFRSIYASFLEVVQLLDCLKPKIVVHTLRLLVSISKTSRFISQHVDSAEQKKLSAKLIAVHECWSRNNTPSMAEAIKSADLQPSNKITYRVDGKSETIVIPDGYDLQAAHTFLLAKLGGSIDDKNDANLAEKTYAVAQLRFNFYMTKLETRIDSAIQRLMSLSVLFYSRCLLDAWRTLSVLQQETVEDICEVIQLEPSAFPAAAIPLIDNVRTEALKAMASIIFLDNPAKLQHILDTLGLNSYIGHAAQLMRNVVRTLKQNETSHESNAFITSLFSLIYHIAGLEKGGPALVSISTVPTLLEVVNLRQLPDSLISFATRAVRIIDILTHIDLNEFITHDGITVVVGRLVYEVEKCKTFIDENEQPAGRRFVIHHHRSALIKSLLNFLKRTVADPDNATNARRIMEGDLPKALIHIVKTPQYYGASLVHCAVELTTMFIYQEPSQLNQLQDRGLCHAILDLLSHEYFPISREIVTSLPTTCSALCLNERGLKIFNEYKPLEQIFRIIFSSAFMQVLRKRKNELNDAAQRIGGAFDELMRHQPTLRKDLITSMVKVISELVKDASREEIHITSRPANPSTALIPGLNADEAEGAAAKRSSPTRTPINIQEAMDKWTDFSEAELQELKSETEKNRRTHLVAEATCEKPTAFSFVQDGNYLPVNDFMVLLVRMVEAMLSHSAVSENSAVMNEAGLPEQLLGFLSIERLVPVVSNPIYLHAVPNVFRLIFQQSHSLRVFELLSGTIRTQLRAVQVHDDLQQFIAPQHSLQLNRLSVLMAIFSSFLRDSLAHTHETRAQVFQHLSSGTDGPQFVTDLFDAIYKISRSIAHFHPHFNQEPKPKEAVEKAEEKKPAADEKKTEDTPPSSTPKPDPVAFTPDPTSNTALLNIQKQLSEVVCQLGRSCHSPRSRRNTDAAYQSNTTKVTKTLFEGIRGILEKANEVENRYVYIQNVLTILRRLLLDETAHLPHPNTLATFLDSGCHQTFFEIGRKLAEEALYTETALVFHWLSTAHRLVSAESFQYYKNRPDVPAARAVQVLSKYLTRAQEDVIGIIACFLDRVGNEGDEQKLSKNEKARLWESVFDLLKEALQTVFYLQHHAPKKTKKDEPVPAGIAAEIDPVKVETLMDMGFTRESALQALSFYTNVQEAMDHLLISGAELRADSRGPSARAEQAPGDGQLQPEEERAADPDQQAAGDANPTESGDAAKADDKSKQDAPKAQEAEETAEKKELDLQKVVAYIADSALSRAMEALAQEPAVVFAIADLMRVLIREELVEEGIKRKLIQTIFVDQTESLLNRLSADFDQTQAELVAPFASHLHLICLLWSSFDETYIGMLETRGFYATLIKLLNVVVEKKQLDSPVLPPLLLWIDLYKKEQRLRCRRQLFNNATEGPIQWFHWPDEQRGTSSTVTWREYPPIHAAAINLAFKTGRSECKLKINERNLTIDFATMTERTTDRTAQSTPVYCSVTLPEDFNVDEFVDADLKIQHSHDGPELIETLVSLFRTMTAAGNVVSDVMFSLLSLIHRLTAVQEVAQRFVELGGVEMMLRVRCEKPALLMSTVICLILRNCIHNETLTRAAFQRIVRDVQAGAPVSLSEQSGKTLSTKQRRFLKDWRRVLRLLAPLVDHNLPAYTELAEQALCHRNQEELQIVPEFVDTPELPIDAAELKNLQKIVSAVIDELVHSVNTPDEHTDCVLQPSTLILFVSELVRSFPPASELLLQRQQDGHSFLQWVVEKLMMRDGQNLELVITCNALFFSLMHSNSSAACNTLLVEVIQNTLVNLINDAESAADLSDEGGKKFCERIGMLTKFMGLLRDCCANLLTRSQTTFIHILYDRHLLVDFCRSILRLPLSRSHAAEAANSIMRLLEDFSRSIGMIKPLEEPKGEATKQTTNTDGSAPAASSSNAPEQPAAGGSGMNAIDEQAEIPPHQNDVSLDLSMSDDDSMYRDAEMDLHNDSGAADGFLDGGAEYDNPSPGRARSDSSSSSSSSTSAEEDHLAGINNEPIDLGGAPNAHQPADVDHLGMALEVIEADREFGEPVPGFEDEIDNRLDDLDHDDAMHNMIGMVEDDGDEEDALDQMEDDGGENDTDMEDEEGGDDDDEMETEDGTVEDEEAQPAARDGNYGLRNYDMGIEMMDEHDMERNDFFPHNGLLQIRSHIPGDAGMFLSNTFRGGVSASLNVLAEYLNELGHYSIPPFDFNGPDEVILPPFGGDLEEIPEFRWRSAQHSQFYPGGASQSALSNGPGTFGTLNAASRGDTSHPLLRRPSRILADAAAAPPAAANTGAAHSSHRDTMNVVVSDRGSGMHAVPPSVISSIENAINALGGALGGGRGRTHRATTAHRSSHHHGLRRQNALRARPFATEFMTGMFGESQRYGAPVVYNTYINDRRRFSHLNTVFNFSEEQGVLRALEESRDNPFMRRVAELFVPFFMDRLTDTTRMLNAQSAQYINVVIGTRLTDVCRLAEEAQVEPQVTTAPPPTEAQPPSVGEPLALRPAEEEEGARSVDQVSVDSSELTNRFASMGEEEANGENDAATEADGERTPQNVAEEPLAEIVPIAESSPSPVPAAPTDEQPAGGQPEAEAEEQPGPSEQRDNSNDLPGGIDPAFLAALPEDIRQEVIRDHERQQRLQRLSEQQRQRQQSTSATDGANAEAPAPNNEEPPAAAPEDEVLDQEFLAALPPELQEEVLAQHEQRLAQQAARNAAAQQPAAANAPAADAIALLDSLAPSLRAQVLAEADESVLQILPENLVAEATRMRQNFEHDEIIRAAHTGFHRETRPYHQSWRNTGAYRHQYAMPPTPSTIVQILDRPSVASIALLYFLDHERFQQSRCQRVFKVISLHPGTCDFVLSAMLGLLNAATNTRKIADEEANPFDAAANEKGWLSRFKVQSTLNSPEQALVLTDDEVLVHELCRSQLCTRVLETLNVLARQSPGQFFNMAIRYSMLVRKPQQTTGLKTDDFWAVVRSLDAECKSKSKFTSALDSDSLSAMEETSDPDIRHCPFGLLLELSTQPPICNTPLLLEKAMRIFHATLVVPASLATQRKEAKLFETDEAKEFLLSRIKKLILSVLDSYSCEESLREFRNFFVQLLFAFPALRYSTFEILFDVVRDQGLRLSKMLEGLREALDEENVGKKPVDPSAMDTTASQETASSAFVGTSQATDSSFEGVAFRKMKSSKRNQPKQLLRTLNIVSFLRTQLTDLYKRRKPSNGTEKEPDANKEALEQEDKLLVAVLDDLDGLWTVLSYCLDKVGQSSDNRMMLSLQYAAEAFFLIHSLAIAAPTPEAAGGAAAPATAAAQQPPAEAERPSTSASQTPEQAESDERFPGLKFTRFTKKILAFAEQHRTVLNQILRSSYSSTMENSAFGVLTHFPSLLDFDVKRKYFHKEIKKLEDRTRYHRDDIAVRIRRNHLFSDSYRELFRLRSSEWKSRFYIIFEGEEGQDAGGLLREWYSIITREVFNPNYALFITAPGDGVTYMINKSSHVNPEHLDYFKFVGRIIAKAIYDNKQLDCYFTRAFYKQILNIPVRYQDIESEDPEYFKNLKFLLENPLENAGVELNFNLEVEEFGVRSWRDLKEGGNKIAVTDENKEEYVKLVCQMKMTRSVRKQLDAFLEGFYEIIPRKLISIFNEQELELLISGLPDIDIDDLYNNTEYRQYTRTSPQIQWFWRALRALEKADLAKFLQFVTGTSKVPLQGFAHLEGMNGAQKFTIHMDTRSSDRLPCAHTCFNQLDLPQYESFEQLQKALLVAIRECTEGFAFA